MSVIWRPSRHPSSPQPRATWHGSAMSLGPIRTGLSSSGHGSSAPTGHNTTDFSHDALTRYAPLPRPLSAQPRRHNPRKSRFELHPSNTYPDLDDPSFTRPQARRGPQGRPRAERARRRDRDIAISRRRGRARGAVHRHPSGPATPPPHPHRRPERGAGGQGRRPHRPTPPKG